MSDEALSRGERTRSDIIRAAHQLFLQRGYHGTSMRQIARTAGIALGGIYNHFTSKEEIFLNVVKELHPLNFVLPAMENARGETIEEFVRDAASQMVAGLGDRMDYINLMFIELVEFKGEHIPRIFQTVLPHMMAFTQRFVTERNDLRAIPLPIMVRAFIGLFFSYMITDLLIAQQLPPEMQENALEHFVDIYLHGIISGAPTGLEV